MTIIKLGKEEVSLDNKLLEFNEVSINSFLANFAARYNYYCEKHADAQYVHSKYQDRYDSIYSQKFKHYKEKGGSDKLADASSRCDGEVVEAADKVVASRHTKDLIWGYLRSMDRAHEDAMQMCYNIRKEMDKLFSTVRETQEDKIGRKLDEVFSKDT